MDIPINGNIEEMKPKVLGPLTSSQAICVAIAGVVEIAGSALVRHLFPGTAVSYIIPAPLAIAVTLLGFAEDFLGMKFKDYMQIIKRSHTYPKFRPYAMHNYMETQEARILAEEKMENPVNKKEVKASKEKQPKIPPELQRYN